MLSKIKELMKKRDFDALSVGVLDFDKLTYKSYEFSKHFYFDLASVTKPLTLAATYLTKKEIFDENLKLLINHEANLPIWGLLSKSSWKEQILSYPIKKSEAQYSDFSALRAMLEIEKKIPSLHKHCLTFWDSEVCFWRDLPKEAICPDTGFRNGKTINAVVHDPNAYVIGSFCSHAGLFGTIDGVCRTLINLEKKNLTEAIKSEYADGMGRYICGWDRAQDLATTLAGKGCGKRTFGHLGFTGTSVWIDPDMKKGVVVLSNATKNYWYAKEGINEIRRTVGTLVFGGEI